MIITLAVQEGFENTPANTMKNGILSTLIHPDRSLLMGLILTLPAASLFVSYRALSVIALPGISGPEFLTSLYLRNLFDTGTKEEAPVL